jgi:DNA-binding response OmpR family regulator
MPRVLVVDDNPDVRFTICQILESHGYDVDSAQDGNEALVLFDNQLPDLVITDIIMPEQEGLGLIRNILARRTDAKILAVSGGGRIGKTDYLMLARRMGASAILPKPFEVEELIDKVEDCLSTPK